MHRVFTTAVADVYPHYVTKVTKKNRTEAELIEVICWLTGYSAKQLKLALKNKTTFAEFFSNATLHPNAELITGTICGVKIQDIEDPLMKQIRYLDKVVDEISKGRPLTKIFRS